MSRLNKVPAKDNPYKSAGVFSQAVFAVNAKVSTTINVGVTLKDEMFGLMPASTATPAGAPIRLKAYLSDDAAGNNLTATTPSGGVAIGTNGVILNQAVSGKTFDILVPSTTAGLFDLSITHSSTHNFYLCIETPTGEIVVSPVIAF